MTVVMRRLAAAAAAWCLLSPVVSAAEDPLLVQKDFDSLSDEDQWKYADAWCIGAIDIAIGTPGYSRNNLEYARKVNADEFVDGEGGTQEELDANVAYATGFYRDQLAGNRMTLDQMLEGCASDPKG